MPPRELQYLPLSLSCLTCRRQYREGGEAGGMLQFSVLFLEGEFDRLTGGPPQEFGEQIFAVLRRLARSELDC